METGFLPIIHGYRKHMLASQLFWRIYSVFAVLTVAATLLFAGLMSAHYRQMLDELTYNRLRDDARRIGSQLVAEGKFEAVAARMHSNPMKSPSPSALLACAC